MKKTKPALPRTIKRDVVISTAILAVWTYVAQIIVPGNWNSSSLPIYLGILASLSPFVVAAVLGYEFLFREVGARFARATHAVIFAIIMFIVTMALAWLVPFVPTSLQYNVALVDLLITMWTMLSYLLTAGLMLWYIHATLPLIRRRGRRA